MRRTVIEVVETATGRVVHTVEVTGKSPTQIERVERGMLINMDTDRYFTREATRPVKSA